jgi:hypothetical protein
MGLLLFVVLGEQKFTPWLIFRYPFNWSFCTVENPRTGDTYQSPEYDTATNRVDLYVETGVGSVDVR